MNLVEALEKQVPKPKNCKCAKILSDLSKEELLAFRHYVEAGLSPARLTAALNDSGHSISTDAVERHVNRMLKKSTGKKCCCGEVD